MAIYNPNIIISSQPFSPAAWWNPLCDNIGYLYGKSTMQVATAIGSQGLQYSNEQPAGSTTGYMQMSQTTSTSWATIRRGDHLHLQIRIDNDQTPQLNVWLTAWNGLEGVIIPSWIWDGTVSASPPFNPSGTTGTLINYDLDFSTLTGGKQIPLGIPYRIFIAKQGLTLMQLAETQVDSATFPSWTSSLWLDSDPNGPSLTDWQNLSKASDILYNRSLAPIPCMCIYAGFNTDAYGQGYTIVTYASDPTVSVGGYLLPKYINPNDAMKGSTGPSPAGNFYQNLNTLNLLNNPTGRRNIHFWSMPCWSGAFFDNPSAVMGGERQQIGIRSTDRLVYLPIAGRQPTISYQAPTEKNVDHLQAERTVKLDNADTQNFQTVPNVKPIDAEGNRWRSVVFDERCDMLLPGMVFKVSNVVFALQEPNR